MLLKTFLSCYFSNKPKTSLQYLSLCHKKAMLFLHLYHNKMNFDMKDCGKYAPPLRKASKLYEV